MSTAGTTSAARDEALLRYRDAALYLQARHRLPITERQLRRNVALGRIPHIRMPNVVLFDPDALDGWVASITHTPPGVS